MKIQKQDIDRLMAEVENVKRQLIKLGATKIILFGSLAEGRISLGSDIDILAVFDDRESFKTRMKKIYSQLDSKEAVDILGYNQEEIQRIKDKPFFRTILAGGRIIYERPFTRGETLVASG